MTIRTILSAAVLGLSGAALAQVAAPTEPKLGNAAGANTSAGTAAGNGADPAANSADPHAR